MRNRFLVWLADVLHTHRRICAAFVILTFALSAYWLAAGHLRLNSSRNGMVRSDNPEQKRFLKYNERFGAGNDIVVVLEGDDPAKLRDSANRAAKQLEALEAVVRVFYRVNLDALATNGLYFLRLDDLRRVLTNMSLVNRVVSKQSDVPKSVKVKGMMSVLTHLNDGIDAFTEGETGGLGDVTPSDKDIEDGVEVVVALIDEFRAWLEDADRKHIGLKAQYAERKGGLNLDAEGYLIALDGKMLLMRVNSNLDLVDDKHAVPLIQSVYEVLKATVLDGVTYGVTGVPALVAEEQLGLKRELPIVGVGSFLGCLLVFFLAYRSFLSTIVVMLPLAVGLTWAMACTAVLIGSLNLLTSPMAVILIGMGIDFSVHLFTRIREERKLGFSASEATTKGLLGAGPPIIMGAMTSAAAFAAMLMTGIRATQEMGTLASTGLVLVMIASFLVLPLLLGRDGTAFGKPQKTGTKEELRWRWPEKLTTPILVVGVLITLFLALSIRPISFNFDANSYLPAESPSLTLIERLEAADVGGVEYAVTQASSLEESRRQYEALVALKNAGGVVDRVESIFDVLPPDLETKEPIVAQIRKAALKVPEVVYVSDEKSPIEKMPQTLEILVENLTNWLPAHLNTLGKSSYNKHIEKLVPSTRRLLEVAKRLDQKQLKQRVARFDAKLGALSVQINDFFRREHAPLHPKDLPSSLVSTFYSDLDGTPVYATRVYPSGTIADPEFTDRFTKELREIDPEATGYAITYMYFGLIMKDGLRDAAFWAACVVLLLLLVDFRNVRDVFLATIPLVMGGVWMVGLMNVFGIDYTFSNTLSIPLIMGIGIDSGIHVLHRFKECGDVGESVRTTGKAILVSSATTICAFGSLMFVNNRGVQTLGVTLTLGVASCVIMALIFLPAVLALLKRFERRTQPQ